MATAAGVPQIAPVQSKPALLSFTVCNILLAEAVTATNEATANAIARQKGTVVAKQDFMVLGYSGLGWGWFKVAEGLKMLRVASSHHDWWSSILVRVMNQSVSQAAQGFHPTIIWGIILG